jgi:hypothetical protein
MSARDAEQHAVDDEERHLFVRLDDAKANLGLISGRARWFRRVGVTITNWRRGRRASPNGWSRSKPTLPGAMASTPLTTTRRMRWRCSIGR